MKRREKQQNKVVSNSSPIIFLSAIDKLSLLNEMFSKVYIPTGVYREIVIDALPDQIGRFQLKKAVSSNKIQIYDVQDKTAIKRVAKENDKLHAGEVEVIVAAEELSINVVLLDDKDARTTAETHTLKPSGTLGLLIRAKQRGKIDQVKKYLDLLIEQHKFRCSTNLYKETLSKAQEEI